MSRITHTQKTAHIGCMHVEKDGDEIKTEAGLTAIVIESEELDPSAMTLFNNS
ncbi:hypothetical protein [Halobacillus litoralis]|uniref:hypothetical protein n=1 Tax=Halobacillus litoralis TaxID=45668 RepID=UPI0039A75D62